MSLRSKLFWGAAGLALFSTARAIKRANHPYSFQDKIVLIVGGSRGLGLVLAREYAKQGALVAVCARDESALETARGEFAARGQSLLALRCDATNQQQVNQLIGEVLARYGRIDVLVNNLGLIQAGPMESMTIQDYEDSLKTHFWAPLYTTLATTAGMKAQGEGRIVNISSIGGKVSIPHLLPYCAGKFALVGLSSGMRSELAKDGIQVTTVCPGLMRTGSPRNADFKGQHRAEYTWFKISDSLPGTSVDARRAAKQIVEASRVGQAELVISLHAKAAATAFALAPGLSASVLGWVNRLLPGPGGIGTRSAKGYESETPLSRSVLTAMTDRAAVENNEV